MGKSAWGMGSEEWRGARSLVVKGRCVTLLRLRGRCDWTTGISAVTPRFGPASLVVSRFRRGSVGLSESKQQAEEGTRSTVSRGVNERSLTWSLREGELSRACAFICGYERDEEDTWNSGWSGGSHHRLAGHLRFESAEQNFCPHASSSGRGFLRPLQPGHRRAQGFQLPHVSQRTEVFASGKSDAVPHLLHHLSIDRSILPPIVRANSPADT